MERTYIFKEDFVNTTSFFVDETQTCWSMLDVGRLDLQSDRLAVNEYLCNHCGDEVLQREGGQGEGLTHKSLDLQ